MGVLVQVKLSVPQVYLPPLNLPYLAGETQTLTNAEYSGLTTSTLASIVVVQSNLPDPVRSSNTTSPSSAADAYRLGKAYTDEAIRNLSTIGVSPPAQMATHTEVQQGDAATLVSAEAYTDTQISAEQTARSSGDAATLSSAQSFTTNQIANLTGTFDPAGAATAATTNSENYTNQQISAEVTRATAADNAILSSAESYTDTEVGQEITNRQAAITTAINNLNLGSAATHNATDFDAAGSATAAQAAAQTAAEADAASKYAPRAIPAWGTVGTSLTPSAAAPVSRYDQGSGRYNWNGANLARYRAALAKSVPDPANSNAPAGKCDVLVIGDSLMIGFNGTKSSEACEIPRVAMQRVASLTGASMGGTGLQRVADLAGAGGYNDRWTFTGTVNIGATYSGYAYMAAGSTLTFTPQSTEQGTHVDVIYYDQSTAFTVSIDGGTAQAVTPGNTAAWKVATFSGLSLAAHTVTINCSTNYVFVFGVRVGSGIGIRVSNMSLGGSYASAANGGTYKNNWTDTSGNSFAIGTVTQEALALLTDFSPDLLIVDLGANDMQGATDDTRSPTIISGLQTIFGWYPNASRLLLSSIAVGTDTPDNWWSDLKSREYALVDALGISMIDMQEHWQPYATYYANGLANTTDNIHPINGAAIAMGNALGMALAI